MLFPLLLVSNLQSVFGSQSRLRQPYPIIDGHNDFPLQIWDGINTLDLVHLPQLQTDITRLKAGHVGAQFWSAYIPCAKNYSIQNNNVADTLHQIDLIHRFNAAYSDTFELAGSVNDVSRIMDQGKIASLIGIEGGHQMDGSLPALRMYHALGVRYMTLTHTCHTSWADSAALPPLHNGLTGYGKIIITEMNRMGMMVDLSHVSHKTMRDVIAITRAPLFFSHSSVYSFCPTERNAPDDVLLAMKQLDGIIMINFWNALISCGQEATMDQLIEHIVYVSNLIGSEHVGLGSDFDGGVNTPVGLEDVSSYPALMDALKSHGFSHDQLMGISHLNVLRVLQKTEAVSDSFKEKPSEAVDPTIKVAVRIRPLSEKELAKEKVTDIVRAHNAETIVVVDPTEDFFEDILRKDRVREKYYPFDHVFDDTASQDDVFEKTVKYLIDSVLHGFNATVFAYGATGAGKTFTMMGNETNPGIMVLTLADLFSKISIDNDSTGGSYEVMLSYLEIYNENIRDLLSGKPDYLELREDGTKGVVVAGITYVPARSPEEILSLLKKGNRYRTQEATGANEVSSRSHAVLQVFVTYRLLNTDGKRIQRFGKLSMIDLAGSERAAETNNRGIRMIEGANINRSLLALGNCINALIETGKKNKYINYRDSKLTRLLKDSLGGNTRTVMIANVSPASNHFDETLNTLKYASRARTIKTKITQQLTTVRDDTYEATTQKIQAESAHLHSVKDHPFSKSFNVDENRWKGNAGSMIHDTIEAPPPTVITKPKGPDAAELALIHDIRSNLETLFAEQLQIRTEMLDSEQTFADSKLSISKKQRRVESLEKRIQGSSGSLVDSEEQDQIRRSIRKLKEELGALEANQVKILSSKAAYDQQLQELDTKIKNTEQSIPPKADKRTRQYLHMQVKGHYLEMDNLDLDLNYTLSSAAVKQKDQELSRLYQLLETYDKLTSLQKSMLKSNDVPVNEKVHLLYKKVRDAQRADTPPDEEESPKPRLRSKTPLGNLEIQRFVDFPSLSENLDTPSQKKAKPRPPFKKDAPPQEKKQPIFQEPNLPAKLKKIPTEGRIIYAVPMEVNPVLTDKKEDRLNREDKMRRDERLKMEQQRLEMELEQMMKKNAAPVSNPTQPTKRTSMAPRESVVDSSKRVSIVPRESQLEKEPIVETSKRVSIVPTMDPSKRLSIVPTIESSKRSSIIPDPVHESTESEEMTMKVKDPIPPIPEKKPVNGESRKHSTYAGKQPHQVEPISKNIKWSMTNLSEKCDQLTLEMQPKRSRIHLVLQRNPKATQTDKKDQWEVYHLICHWEVLRRCLIQSFVNLSRRVLFHFCTTKSRPRI